MKIEIKDGKMIIGENEVPLDQIRKAFLSRLKNKQVELWVEKYRPKTLSEVIGHEDVVKILKSYADSGEIPNILLYGPPGTGKTTIALAFARDVYGDAFPEYVLELNASDDRGIDVIRTQIKSFVRVKTRIPRLVIMDEADSMTFPAQNALRRLMEKYASSARFFFTANYISGIHPAIRSRTLELFIKPLTVDDFRMIIQRISKEEKFIVESGVVEELFRITKGDCRAMINALQGLAKKGNGVIRVEDVRKFFFTPVEEKISQLLTLVMLGQLSIAIGKIQEVSRLPSDSIIRKLYSEVVKIRLAPHKKLKLLSELAEIEYRLKIGASPDIQLMHFLYVFSEILKEK